jgi:uncharacterized protein YjiS (DUF1127 family)
MEFAMIVAHLFRAAMRAIQSVAVQARSFQRAGMAHDTCRALDELPDSLLKDMGIARSEICFVAGALVSTDGESIRNAFDRPSRAAAQSPAMRRDATGGAASTPRRTGLHGKSGGFAQTALAKRKAQ